MTHMNDKPHPDVETSPAQGGDDMDAYRIELTRHITRFLADHFSCWERCDERECRRARACRAQDDCPMLPPPPVLTPEEEAECRAEVYHAVRTRLAELGLDEADEIDQQS